jgi:hypothetical protein
MAWRIEDLSSDVAEHDPGDTHWPIYGALLVNLRNITGFTGPGGRRRTRSWRHGIAEASTT